MTRPTDDDMAWLDPHAEQELEEALRAAYAPGHLDPRVNDQLVRAALEDPLAPPSEEELVASERLKRALEGGPAVPDAHLARSVAAAVRSGAIDAARSDSLADRALARRAPRTNVVYVAFGAGALVTAAAAAALLFLLPAHERPQTPPAAAFVSSRTTTELFAEKFEPGRTTERVDAIARARQRDLRRNRYLAWGVE